MTQTSAAITEAPSGGGATYVIPGVAEANGSSVPLIVFTSDVPVVDEGKGTLTAIDQQRLLEAATKWSATVKRAAMLPDIIRRAFRYATSGRGVAPTSIAGAFSQHDGPFTNAPRITPANIDNANLMADDQSVAACCTPVDTADAPRLPETPAPVDRDTAPARGVAAVQP